MGYYQAGDYYRGDGNYAAGGIFGTIGKFLGGAAKAVIKASPIGGIVSTVVPSFGVPQLAPGIPAMPKPGVGGAISRLLPGGDTGYFGKRRRINVTNVKALRRAGRRVRGFLKLASRLGALPVNRGKGKRLFKRKAR